ncbi:MAG: hypothetical protein ACT4QG_08800 [Sporichthyaceae bacterium]
MNHVVLKSFVLPVLVAGFALVPATTSFAAGEPSAPVVATGADAPCATPKPSTKPTSKPTAKPTSKPTPKPSSKPCR